MTGGKHGCYENGGGSGLPVANGGGAEKDGNGISRGTKSDVNIGDQESCVVCKDRLCRSISNDEIGTELGTSGLCGAK